VMGQMFSAFHPIFWMHHNNVDRIYESYLQNYFPANVDSTLSRAEQAREQMRLFQDNDPETAPFLGNVRLIPEWGDSFTAEGFPEGPYGPLMPFTHPFKPSQPIHAADTFETAGLGYRFDALLRPREAGANLMREMPTFARFASVDIRKIAEPVELYVFVHDKRKKEAWKPPSLPRPSVVELLRRPDYAGIGAVFFLNTPDGCPNCLKVPILNVQVPLTAWLRKSRLPPKYASLHVLAKTPDGTFLSLEKTKIPLPTLKGPTFSSNEECIGHPGKPEIPTDELLKADVEVLQQIMVERQFKETKVVDGAVGEKTREAIKYVQRTVGIHEDGVAGPVTKRVLTLNGLRHDTPKDGPLKRTPSKVITWRVAKSTVPAYLSEEDVAAEMSEALSTWAAASGGALAFKRLLSGSASQAPADLTFLFEDHTPKNEFVFDGPGGALAYTSSKSITFDASERWELVRGLRGKVHPDRTRLRDDFYFFALLPVAIHEVGHVLGLKHTFDAADVMSPYYMRHRIDLSAGDKAALRAILA